MKFKGNKYKEQLLSIRKLQQGTKRRAAVKAAAEAFGVSAQTIYRELKKKPSLIGVRDERSDAGNDRVKISKKELSLFDEHIQNGKTLQQARELIEKNLNVKISHNKLNKISGLLKSKTVNDNSNYGSAVKTFIARCLKLDEIGFGKTVAVKFNGGDKTLTVQLTKQDIEQINMICASRYNMTAYSEKNKLRVDDNRLLRMQLKYIVAEQIQLAMESGSLAALDSLSLIQGRLDDSVGVISPDFKLALITIQNEFKQAITPEELLSLFEKYSEQISN